VPPTEKVVVIGGAGFIGRHLTKYLLEAGCEVTVVSRTAGLKQQPGLRYVRATVADADKMMEVCEGATVVYDLSSGGGATWADYERDYIHGSANVARACLKHGVRRLIYTSSISALYLGGRRKVMESEGADPKSEERNAYARAKAAAERVLLKFHAQEKLPVVIVRPAIVLGPGGFLIHGALGNAVSATCLLGWGKGDNPLPCVLARDVAGAMMLAKDAPGVDGKAFNLSSDVRPSAQEIVAYIREKTLRNYRFYPRSLWVMGLSSFVINTIKKMLHKPCYETFRDLKSNGLTADLDCSSAKKLLGWRPETDRKVFFEEAFGSHVKPVPPGDLRLEKASG
jgi:nucleoside-diphosphate-sugar epimerase